MSDFFIGDWLITLSVFVLQRRERGLRRQYVAVGWILYLSASDTLKVYENINIVRLLWQALHMAFGIKVCDHPHIDHLTIYSTLILRI